MDIKAGTTGKQGVHTVLRSMRPTHRRTSEVETIYSACSSETEGDTLGVRGDVRVRLTRGLEAPLINDLVPTRRQRRA
jgi:hypothetical protein